tara:strand:+ start:273 stop:515 length:243 start_codon:yes stop_codon:yes gene_type:complete
MKADNNDMVDTAMAMIGAINKEYINTLVKTKPEPKHSYEFGNDLLAIKRLQAFVEFVRTHNPSMFESAYKHVSDTIRDNE